MATTPSPESDTSKSDTNGAASPRRKASPAAVARRPIEAIGSAVIGLVCDLGGMTLMLGQVLAGLFRRPWRVGLILQQMDFIGVGSAFLVMLTGFFTGMVFAQQVGSAFAMFSADPWHRCPRSDRRQRFPCGSTGHCG